MGVGLVRSLQPPDILWIHWRVYNYMQGGTLSAPFWCLCQKFSLSLLYFNKSLLHTHTQTHTHTKKIWSIYTMEYSVQFSRSVVSDSLRPHELQHARPSCPSQLPEFTQIHIHQSVMPSSHLILCHPLLLPLIPPSIKVFSNESTLCVRWPKYWSFSFMGNRWGKSGNSVRFYFGGLQNHYRWWLQSRN